MPELIKIVLRFNLLHILHIYLSSRKYVRNIACHDIKKGAKLITPSPYCCRILNMQTTNPVKNVSPMWRFCMLSKTSHLMIKGYLRCIFRRLRGTLKIRGGHSFTKVSIRWWAFFREIKFYSSTQFWVLVKFLALWNCNAVRQDSRFILDDHP